MHTTKWKLLFEPHDLWVGCYWTFDGRGCLHLYCTLISMFPLHIVIPTTICVDLGDGP